MRYSVLDEYGAIILRVEAIEYLENEDVELLKGKVTLIDGSVLRISEVWVDGKLEKYSYFWLDEENDLIIGWDNAPHHIQVNTYPHHKHTKRGVVESDAHSLEAVMDEICKRFG